MVWMFSIGTLLKRSTLRTRDFEAMEMPESNLHAVHALVLDDGDDADVCFPVSHRVRAIGRSGELEFMLALLPAMQHAPNQRHTVKVLDNGDSECRHIDHSPMESKILSQPPVLSNSTRVVTPFGDLGHAGQSESISPERAIQLCKQQISEGWRVDSRLRGNDRRFETGS